MKSDQEVKNQIEELEEELDNQEDEFEERIEDEMIEEDSKEWAELRDECDLEIEILEGQIKILKWALRE